MTGGTVFAFATVVDDVGPFDGRPLPRGMTSNPTTAQAPIMTTAVRPMSRGRYQAREVLVPDEPLRISIISSSPHEGHRILSPSGRRPVALRRFWQPGQTIIVPDIASPSTLVSCAST